MYGSKVGNTVADLFKQHTDHEMGRIDYAWGLTNETSLMFDGEQKQEKHTELEPDLIVIKMRAIGCI